MRYVFFILRAQNFSRATISFHQTDNEKKRQREREREREREKMGRGRREEMVFASAAQT